ERERDLARGVVRRDAGDVLGLAGVVLGSTLDVAGEERLASPADLDGPLYAVLDVRGLDLRAIRVGEARAQGEVVGELVGRDRRQRRGQTRDQLGAGRALPEGVLQQRR